MPIVLAPTTTRSTDRQSRARLVLGTVLGGVLVSAVAAVTALLVTTVSGLWAASVGAAVVTLLALPAGVSVLHRWRVQRSALVGDQGRLRLSRGLATSGVALAVTLTWIWPHADAVTPPTLPGTTEVALSDGSKLTVHVTRSPSATQPPLVVVHGGPGVADLSHDVAALGRLAVDRDVYVYDQLGAGGSDRLDDPDGYTDKRALTDLDAVVRLTGGARVALLGHSWGARLVTKYAVAHRDRVSALILSAPGFAPVMVTEPQRVGDPTNRLDARQRLHLYTHLLRPRNLFTYALSRVDLDVAHQAAGDEEMDARFADIYRHTTPGLFCDSSLADSLGVTGLGYYAHEALVTDSTPLYAPGTPADLRRSITAPTLIIKPACDYLPWSTVTEYAALAPAAHLVVLPDAGHQAYIEKPDAYARLTTAFLSGRPVPLPLTDPAGPPPPSYRGER